MPNPATTDLLTAIEDRANNQAHVADHYRTALTLVDADVDWPTVNEAIMDRWTTSGLLNVKKLAWGGQLG